MFQMKEVIRLPNGIAGILSGKLEFRMKWFVFPMEGYELQNINLKFVLRMEF